MRVCVAIFFRRRFLELLRFTLSLALSHEEKGIMALKINHYRIFCNLSPLPAGEGIMVLKINRYRIFCNPSPLPVGEG